MNCLDAVAAASVEAASTEQRAEFLQLPVDASAVLVSMVLRISYCEAAPHDPTSSQSATHSMPL